MCGIAGLLGRWPAGRSREIGSRMIDALAHRGPDGRRVQTLAATPDTHLTLAHARLSILDLSGAAAQPMYHEETASWLVYNGEIYNYRDLRAHFEAKGHRFRSTGDTEVLLHALVAWGADALPRLNGMYAFAFWDGRSRSLMLGRDPLGIKPLLLARTSRGMMFASELRSLLASGLVESRLSPGAIRSFLTYGAVIEPETICASVIAVPPGHVVRASPHGRLAPPDNIHGLDKLLELHGTPPSSDLSRDACERSVGEALEQAIVRHLAADVRVGVLLSGGIDSPLLAATADRVSGAALEFLTVGVEGDGRSEVKAAEAVARRLGRTHTRIVLSGRELAAMIPSALAAMDQPTTDGFNTFVVSSAAARSGLRVLLSGLGGDELFGGYTTFRRAPAMARYGRMLALAAPLLAAVDPARRAQWRKLAQARRIVECREGYLLQRAIYWGDRHQALSGQSGPPDDYQLPPETFDGLGAAAAWDPFHQISYLELTLYMRNQLLRDADTFSSAAAVEMRVPYLDADVVRAAWRLSPSEQMTRGRGKAVPRRLLSRRLPGIRTDGPKKGFTFPWDDWLRGPLKPLVADVLQSTTAYHALGLDAQAGRGILNRFLAKRDAVSWLHVWSLFVLLYWQGERQQVAAA